MADRNDVSEKQFQQGSKALSRDIKGAEYLT